MWLSLIVCHVFSIGNGPRRNRPPTVAASQFLLSQYYCYWVPATKASWCTIHQSSVLHLPRVLRHLHCCPFFKCTIHISSLLHLQSPVLRLLQGLHQSPVLRLLQVLHPSSLSSVLHLHCSAVLLHLLATILCHVIMLLDNSTLSTILLPM